MSETTLPARFVFLIPRCQRCRDSKILVTMAFWEAHSRHAGELSVFCFAKKPIQHCHTKGEKFKKSSKALQQPLSLKSVFAPGFLLLVTPYYQWVLLALAQSLPNHRLVTREASAFPNSIWRAFAPRDTNRQ